MREAAFEFPSEWLTAFFLDGSRVFFGDSSVFQGCSSDTRQVVNIESVFCLLLPKSFSAMTVKDLLPFFVGDPVMSPEGDMLSPAGSLPFARVHVNGGVPEAIS